MTDLEITQADVVWWSPFLAVALIALFTAACWVLVHPHITWTYLRLCVRRSRAYRARLRNARHARPSLVRSLR